MRLTSYLNRYLYNSRTLQEISCFESRTEEPQKGTDSDASLDLHLICFNLQILDPNVVP